MFGLEDVVVVVDEGYKDIEEHLDEVGLFVDVSCDVLCVLEE